MDAVTVARLAGLDPAFRLKVEHTLTACEVAGFHLRVTYGPRSPVDQAKLWRRSRSSAEVRDALTVMRGKGALWLASMLEGVGPQPSGAWATNALPGQSWHQHGLAVDVVWLVNGAAVWTTGPGSGYDAWRTIGTANGLHRGPVSDWAHMQGPPEGGPRMGWPELDRAMRERWAV